MPSEAPSPPNVSLSRSQWIRLVVVGFFVVFVVARVVPDAIRIAVPLGVFGYVTDDDGVVVKVPEHPGKGSDRLQLGDRIRIDHIKPFDRKPGLARVGFTRENFDRRLPIERDGKERVLRLHADLEPLPSRLIAVIRILIFLVSVGLGAILVLVKPSVATFGFFAFCLGGEYPTTYADVALPVPWREIPQWAGDTIRGASSASLLLFALCLAIESPQRQRILGVALTVLGLVAGTLNAYRFWLLTYAGRPALHIAHVYAATSGTLIAATIVVFVVTFIRARGIERQRTGWIVAAFAVAGAARLLSEQLFPAHITFWENGALLTATVIPIIVVWIAVLRHRFFNVDFVVSRAMVYVAITATVIGTITISEEILSYIFYNNTDLATGIVVAISLAVGSLFGKIKQFLDGIVDRFIFRDRSAQRKALELIAGYILDAETADDVYRALLEDAAHALKLTFSGIMTRMPDGSYELTQSHNWPADCEVRIDANDALTRRIMKSRSILTFAGRETSALRQAIPNERLAFAAPIFFDRSVTAIVVYGHSVSGLDLDPDERQLMVRVVAHASIALGAIELAKYRSGAVVPVLSPN